MARKIYELPQNHNPVIARKELGSMVPKPNIPTATELEVSDLDDGLKRKLRAIHPRSLQYVVANSVVLLLYVSFQNAMGCSVSL